MDVNAFVGMYCVVRTPALAVRAADGDVLVRAGKRRTRLTREATRSTIAAYTVDAVGVASERITQHMTESDQREALTDRDRAGAFQQQDFEDLSVITIAKTTRSETAAVKRSSLRQSSTRQARRPQD
jgi:ParB family chromosome partitioning protein